MADTAYQTLYRDEWIHGFERDQALLRHTVTTQTMSMERGARQAVFLVAVSNREAVTRGNNGLIPASTDDLTQSTVTLAEAHDLPQKTRFNIFAGQSDQRSIMQVTSRGVINRHIDDIIIDALETGTIEINATATASIMTKQVINRMRTTLRNAHVQFQRDRPTLLLSPGAWAALSDIASFTSSDYVSGRPLENGPPPGPEVRRWMGFDVMEHDGLPGAGTADAICFAYVKSAVGHAYNDIQALSGYDEEQDYSWFRTTIYDGALKIQNAGIVKFHHDDTPFV